MLKEMFDRTVPIQYIGYGSVVSILIFLGSILVTAYLSVWIEEMGVMSADIFFVVSVLLLTVLGVIFLSVLLENLRTDLGEEYIIQKFS